MVALVRRLSATKRVGHGGTLDPFAAGVLPLYLGRATRVVEYHLRDDKRYRATICFGATSTTDDLEGELTPVDGPPPDRVAVEAALAAFRGPIEQVPPSYSAIKVAGRRAYAMARAGEQPVLKARQVTIHSIDLVEWDGSDPERPFAIVDIRCSAGTYIRAIARDLGAVLGNSAYLGALVRTASGPFGLDDAVPLETARAAANTGREAFAALLLPVDAGLDAMPAVVLTPAEIEAVVRGQFIKPAGWRADPAADAGYRLLDDAGALVAVAAVRGGRLAPDKVLRDGQGTAGAARAGAAAGGESGATGTGSAVDADFDAGPNRVAAKATLETAQQRRDRRLTASRHIDGLAALRPDDGPLFVAVGVFDGLHRGHRYLLDHLRAEAARRSARATVITFDAHPEEILLGKAPPILVDPAERLVRLGDAGIELTVVQPFDLALRMTPFEAFVAMIRERTALAGFLMTPDAAFGHERGGTPAALAALGQSAGFEVVVVPPFDIAGRQVRSADIRRRIAAGELAVAAELLGRPVAVAGEIRRTPGDPALSLRFPLPVALPPAGRYAVEIEPAWKPDVRRGPVVPGTALIRNGESGAEPSIELSADEALPPVDRLRVSFLGPGHD